MTDHKKEKIFCSIVAMLAIAGYAYILTSVEPGHVSAFDLVVMGVANACLMLLLAYGLIKLFQWRTKSQDK